MTDPRDTQSRSPSSPTKFRGTAEERLEEVHRFLREHGDHHLRRFEGDEEFGYFDGFTCDSHEAELQLIPAVRGG